MKKVFVFLTACFLSACSASADQLDDRTYRLQNAANDARITISFNPSDHTYSGNAAVNRYFGDYKDSSGKLTLNPAGVTMMTGPEPLMRAEREYLKTLPQVVSFKRSGDELTLTVSDGRELVFGLTNETDE